MVVLPQYGALSGTPPQLLYMPKPDYNGPDSFQFKVNDGQLDSSNAVVSIQILPVNDPPVADPQSLTNFEDTPFPITLSRAGRPTCAGHRLRVLTGGPS